METQTIDLSQLSTEELKKHLEEREKTEKREKAEKLRKYETRKHRLVDELVSTAKDHQETLQIFKDVAFEQMRGFYDKMREYGDVSEANKGNFSIKNASGTRKVEFSRQVISGFDERAGMAEAKLKEFLAATVKKRDLATYELVISLLERNKVTGDFDSRNIQKLYKIEDKFDHPLWKEAIALFKEAYTEQATNYYIRFFEMDSTGKYQSISLNFASLDVNEREKEGKE